MPSAIVSLPQGAQSPGLSFLGLPPEIRNEVYKWLFPIGRSAAQLLARHNGGYISMSDRFGLLVTCRQIYNEASSLLRGQQRFTIVQPKTLFEVMDTSYELEDNIIDCINPDWNIRITYDLDHHIMRNDEGCILQVNRELRERVSSLLMARISVTVSITNDFRGLKQWAQNQRSRTLLSLLPDPEQDIRIVLRFPQPSGGNTAIPCIEAAKLLWATSELHAHVKLGAVLISKEEAGREQDTELFLIRGCLLLFVHTLTKKTSGDAYAKFWINKNLEISHADLEHEDGTIECVLNKEAKRSWEQTIKSLYGKGIIRDFRNIEDSRPCNDSSCTENEGTSERRVSTEGRETLLCVAKSLAKTLVGPVQDWF